MSDDDFEEILNDENLDNNQQSSSDKLIPDEETNLNNNLQPKRGKNMINAAKTAASSASKGGIKENTDTAANTIKNRPKNNNNNKSSINNSEEGSTNTEAKTTEDNSLGDNKKSESDSDKKETIKDGAKLAKSVATKDVKSMVDSGKSLAKKLLAKKLKKVKLILGVVVVLAFGLIVMIGMILATIQEGWENFDNKSRRLANNIEELTNLYRGFGYQDSKSAFYQELNELDKVYEHELDVPLLLATLFYTESMGFDTSYQEHLDIMNGDPVTAALTDGGADGAVNFFAVWVKDIMEESQTTYDEKGLSYNAGKIYRLRRLAAAMCDRSGTPTTITLEEFAEKYSVLLGKTLKDVINAYISKSVDDILIGLSAMISVTASVATAATLDSSSDVSEFDASIIDLMKIATFGLMTISSIGLNTNGELTVTYTPYKVNKDQYDSYVKNYYFENNPEFTKLLPENSSKRDEVKDQILKEIYMNKELFSEIFLGYNEGESENYQDACVGAIDSNLVSALKLPVDINQAVSFDSDSSYGIVNGKVHKGVDLNSTTAGVNQSANVYSIAVGTVEDIGEDDSDEDESGGKWIKIKHEDVEVNGTEYTFYSVYRNLDSNSVTLSKGDGVSSGQTIGIVGTTKSGVAQLHFEFRDENDSAIDPTNLFIECVSNGGTLVGDTNEIKIANYLLGIGYNYVQVSAILANIYYESSYNPSALNSISCKGISQWCFSRALNLVDYTSSKSSDWSSLDLQLNFLKAEIKNEGDAVSYASSNSINISYYKSVVDHLENYSDPDEATYYYCMNFEVPGESYCSTRKNGGKGKEWYDYLVSNVVNTTTSTSTYDGSYGQQIVSEASKYVGNPYVYGGSSLTNGCDCSHFVYLVLQNLGYNVSYQTTDNWNQGTQISIDEAQPGDVFVISSHMGFIGNNGYLVEAKGAAYGITNDRTWDNYKSQHPDVKVYRMYSDNIN